MSVRRQAVIGGHSDTRELLWLNRSTGKWCPQSEPRPVGHGKPVMRWFTPAMKAQLQARREGWTHTPAAVSAEFAAWAAADRAERSAEKAQTRALLLA